MKKAMKRALLMMGFAMIFVITACGSRIDSELNVSESGEVTRTFTITANIADNREHVTGEVADITATVQSNCPEVLEFTDLSTDTDVIYQFSMSCSSIDEYEEALKSLLDYDGTFEETYGEDYDIVSFSMPDSVFASGVYYREQLSEEQYMKWFEDLMINSGYVQSSDRSNIFDNSSTTYNVCGEEGSNGYGISINTVQTVQINSIELYTSYNDDNTLDRKIVIRLPQASMDAKGDEITEFLEANETSGITGEWTVADGVNTYTLLGSSLSVEELNDMMKKFYAIDGEYVTVNYNPTDASVNTYGISDFYTVTQISESKDLSSFVADPQYVYINFSYKVSIENNVNLTEDNIDYSDVYMNEDQNYVFCRAAELGLNNATVSVAPSAEEEGNITRTVELFFNNDAPSGALKALETRLKNKCQNTSIRVLEVTGTEDGMTKIVLESDEEFDDEPDCWLEVFGSQNELDINYINTKFPSLLTTIKYEDTFDLSPFGYSPEDVDINVTFRVSGLDRMKAEEQVLAVDGNEPAEFSVEQKSLNIAALIIWIVIIVLIVGVVVAAIIVIPKLTKGSKPAAKKPAAPAPAPAPAPATEAPAAEAAPEAAEAEAEVEAEAEKAPEAEDEVEAEAEKAPEAEAEVEAEKAEEATAEAPAEEAAAETEEAPAAEAEETAPEAEAVKEAEAPAEAEGEPEKKPEDNDGAES